MEVWDFTGGTLAMWYKEQSPPRLPDPSRLSLTTLLSHKAGEGIWSHRCGTQRAEKWEICYLSQAVSAQSEMKNQQGIQIYIYMYTYMYVHLYVYVCMHIKRFSARNCLLLAIDGSWLAKPKIRIWDRLLGMAGWDFWVQTDVLLFL